MGNNNGFLSNYGKNMGDMEEPASEVVVRDVDLGYKYEQKSGFKKPDHTGGSGLPPFRRPKLLVPIIAGAAVVAGIIIMLILLLNGGVAVIDLTGRTLSDAQLWANQNGVMLTTDEQFNDEYEANTIIAQDRAPGETVKKGEFLSLTVSKGHDMSATLEVPDIMSMTAGEIEAWADENYMSKVRITTEFSDTVPSGNVIRFEINDNTVVSEIRRDTPVYVIVSKGPEDQSAIQVTVPDFKTMTISEAYIFANENGLTLTIEEQYDDYVPKNSVISQSVKAKEKVSRGSEIELIVSKGKMIEIPDFSDYTKEQAVAVASDFGIPVTIIEKYSSSRSAGKLVKQSISAGSVYEEGDYLELTYSLGSKVAVANYVGMTRDAIESWANELNKQGASIKIKVAETKSNQPKGTIIYQDIANAMVSVKTTINITVSLGRIIYVPDFIVPDTITDPNRGYETAVTREEAIEMCESIGLVPVFVEDNNADSPDRLPGEVWSQSLNAGTEVTEGTKITLKYKPNAITDVPDFIGHTKAEIEDDPVKYGKCFTIVFEGEGTNIIAQSLAKKTQVPKGSVIVLTLSP
jgi:beta-lactam-binding protein with PASTA domain